MPHQKSPAIVFDVEVAGEVIEVEGGLLMGDHNSGAVGIRYVVHTE